MQKFLRRLERFSQSLLSPLSYLSAAGLLLVLGALLTSKPLCQALPVLQWAPLQLVGQLLYNGMMVLIKQPQRHSLRGGGCRARQKPKSRMPPCWR
mgnify:CR=1 FL=1